MKKCEGCKYYGRVYGAPETVEKDCLWELEEDKESSVPPCECDEEEVIREIEEEMEAIRCSKCRMCYRDDCEDCETASELDDLYHELESRKEEMKKNGRDNV